MIAPAAENTITNIPSHPTRHSKAFTKSGLHLDPGSPDEEQDIFSLSGDMTIVASPSPFIKDEPDDLQFSSGRIMGQNAFDIGQSFGGQHYPSQHGDGGINPSELIGTSGGNSGFISNAFGSQNLSNSFMLGSSNIPDDELLDLGNLDEHNSHVSGFMQDGNTFDGHSNANPSRQGYFSNASAAATMSSQSMHQPMPHPVEASSMQSPYLHDFGYGGQFRSINSQNPAAAVPGAGGLAHSMPSGIPNGSMRPKLYTMDRHNSDSRSPITPKTPGTGAFHLGTPDSGSFPTQPIMTNQFAHGHQKTISGHWDHHTPASGSWVESPLGSPQSSMHPQISEVLTSTKHASHPGKAEPGSQAASLPAYQSQEAKRRRRRESHNMVERRRRDNINERIADLSRLVPQHRLEDEKVRKHIQNNGPLSPSIVAGGMSPPPASMLSGAAGRRSVGGNITQGLPLEDKDKGPNKGDILNGAVGWTRDLMWMLYRVLQKNEEYAQQIHELGGEVPFDRTEEERRMRTELLEAVERNGAANFHYSRGPGTGLRVPKHTTLAGEPLSPEQQQLAQQGHGHNPISPQSLSPSAPGSNNGSAGGHGQQQFWLGADGGRHGSFSLKEEDEYAMEI